MDISHILDRSFYNRNNVVTVAKELLGKFLVTNFDGQLTSGMIVETEAYRGKDDKACHAYPDKKTKRTAVMFEEGGISYVYLCYGVHHLFNVITSEKDVCNGVLIRAIEPKEGIDVMLKRRKKEKMTTTLTSGPGTLSQAMGLQFQHHDALDITTKQNGLWLEDRGILIQQDQIIESRRVGVDFAGDCALRDWRFRIKDNPWTSKGKGKGE